MTCGLLPAHTRSSEIVSAMSWLLISWLAYFSPASSVGQDFIGLFPDVNDRVITFFSLMMLNASAIHLFGLAINDRGDLFRVLCLPFEITGWLYIMFQGDGLLALYAFPMSLSTSWAFILHFGIKPHFKRGLDGVLTGMGH